MTGDEAQAAPQFASWAIVEVMGYRKYAGYVTEQSIAGAGLIRVGVPATPADVKWGNAAPATKSYTKLVGVGSVYAITPCTEDVARRAAREIERGNDPIPVDLPKLLPAPSTEAVVEHVQIEMLDDEDDDDLPFDGVVVEATA